MNFSDTANILALTPYTSPSKGKIFYDHVLKYKPKKCLELGFAHGVATNYIAAALQELNTGSITAVDLIKSKYEKPNIEELLEKTKLNKYVLIKREVQSYNWFLNKEIENNSDSSYNCKPIYDLIFIDGPKDWTIDGFAFFLSDKLLKINGWIVFDDYMWSDYEKIDQKVPDYNPNKFDYDQITKPNIKEVFHKLVMQHPNYSNFKITDDTLAWAQKIDGNQKKILSFESKASFKYKMIHTLKKILGRKY